jgi:hypothetical protein
MNTAGHQRPVLGRPAGPDWAADRWAGAGGRVGRSGRLGQIGNLNMRLVCRILATEMNLIQGKISNFQIKQTKILDRLKNRHLKQLKFKSKTRFRIRNKGYLNFKARFCFLNNFVRIKNK